MNQKQLDQIAEIKRLAELDVYNNQAMIDICDDMLTDHQIGEAEKRLNELSRG